MRQNLPVTLTPDLTISIGSITTRVTPTAGLRLAERLIKVSTRELVRQEAELAQRSITRKAMTR